ncbi:MAG: hypothetical protein ACE5HV_06990 [Acidobacteriota bacterium]
MSEQQPTVSITPEPDDFASRYDRLVEPGSGSWAIRALAVLVAILVVLGSLAHFLWQ